MRLLLLLTAAVHLWSADPMFTVHPEQVLREGADRWLGINLNYIRDLDVNRPAGSRPLAAALDDLGVRWLRFPGGEKSDFHRFAKPPYAKPKPVSLGWYQEPQGKRMDFDAYIAICRKRGAEPYVVVACDSPERTGATWDEQLAHAVAWVRVRLGGLGGTVSASRLSGSSPDDLRPVQDAPAPLVILDGAVGPLTLPPLSITVITGR